MKPYYLLEVSFFDYNKDVYSTPYQIGLDNISDDAPTINFKKCPNQVIANFTKYNLNCELAQNKKGRAYGTKEIFEKFILIEEKIFYHSKSKNILIVQSSKDIFNAFVHKFTNPPTDSILKIKKMNVDFNYIISNQYSFGVEGVWLGNYPDLNINAMYMLGNRIENSAQYHEQISKGAQVTNITILFKYNNKTEKIMITKDCGIILYNDTPETDALLLVEDVYSKFICKKSY